MAIHEGRRGWINLSALALGVLWIGLAGGCDRSETDPVSHAIAGQGADATSDESVPVDPRMQQTFAEATRQDPPADWQRPPDVTMTGKSVGKMYSDVIKSWDTYRFLNNKGQIITCTATLETEFGPV